MSAHPGRLIDVGGFRLHLHSVGSPHPNVRNVPSIIFDAALAGTSVSWSLVEPLVARVARAYSYDRAGLGWSDAGPAAHRRSIATELHDCSPRRTPHLLVRHSFGRLVRGSCRPLRDGPQGWSSDPAHPGDWSRRRKSAKIKGAPGCAVGLWRPGSLAHRGGARRLGRDRRRPALVTLASRGGLRQEDEGILPASSRPRGQSRLLTEPKFYDASAARSIDSTARPKQSRQAAAIWRPAALTISSTSAVRIAAAGKTSLRAFLLQPRHRRTAATDSVGRASARRHHSEMLMARFARQSVGW